jgi:hypothetical protein
MMTHEEIIDDLYDAIINEWSNDTIREFASTPLKDLVKFHHDLGMQIRNYYKLWEIPWEPEMKEYMGAMCDCSPYHPDAVSNTIIQEVWKRLQ